MLQPDEVQQEIRQLRQIISDLDDVDNRTERLIARLMICVQRLAKNTNDEQFIREALLGWHDQP